jgi:hypothetical protein
MRNVISLVHLSLDGFMTGPNGEEERTDQYETE